MNLIQTTQLNRITFSACKQGVRSAVIGTLAPEFEKSAIELKPNFF